MKTQYINTDTPKAIELKQKAWEKNKYGVEIAMAKMLAREGLISHEEFEKCVAIFKKM